MDLTDAKPKVETLDAGATAVPVRHESPTAEGETVNTEPVADIVIVNYNAASYLYACLQSVVTESVAQIVVVDNASTDNSSVVVEQMQREYPNIRWLPAGANLGFGGGVNRGFAATTQPFVFVMNPDAEIRPGAISSLLRFATSNPTVGVVGPRVVNLDGTTYPSARAFPNMVSAMLHGAFGLILPNNRWSKRYRTPSDVDWVSGTAMLLRRDAFESIGGFDERYFMYVEDVDLCWRLKRAGWEVAFDSAATVSHRIGGSSEHAPYRMIVAHHRSLMRFARSSTVGATRLVLPLVAVGLVARTIVASVARVVRKAPPAAQIGARGVGSH
jgi:N-acetylglucosaminyl-diphospho-decaprenol L-rhamnosyltransferase